MKFRYCPDCGEKLSKRDLGDEKEVSWCEKCERPFFEMFSTCVIVLCRYKDRYAVIRQSYGDTEKYVLVAGYMKIGESASEAAAREVHEELGLDVSDCVLINSYPYEKKEQLMLGVLADVKSEAFSLSSEVRDAKWYTQGKAREKLKNAFVALELFNDCIKYEEKTEK